MTRLEQSTEVRAPIERVHDFLVELDNFAAIFPGSVVTKKNFQGNPKVGDTYDISGDVAGQRLKATMRFIELVPNAMIVSEQVSGDFKSFRDTVIFEKTDGGTRLTETWEYEPPYSFLGKILDAVKIRREMENYLVEGHKQAKETLEKT